VCERVCVSCEQSSMAIKNTVISASKKFRPIQICLLICLLMCVCTCHVVYVYRSRVYTRACIESARVHIHTPRVCMRVHGHGYAYIHACAFVCVWPRMRTRVCFCLSSLNTY